MAGTTLDIENLLSADSVAEAIGRKFDEWNSSRKPWIAEKNELRNYVFATDTRTTSNKNLPWANTTTTPKMTQIYDNLKANYSAALFPSANWMRWEANDLSSNTKTKRDAIQSYMQTKVIQSQFEITADRLIDDFVLYGNCFATVDYVEDTSELDTGEQIVGYIGPKLIRISPYDIVFNPTAADFKDSPKIIRSIVQLGDVRKMIDGPEDADTGGILEKMLKNRQTVSASSSTDKSEGYVADGFGSIEQYYGSDYVEILTFYGDMYDPVSGTLLENYKITVVDRAYVISQKPIVSWLGKAPIFHTGWRGRPDNLYAMGPLDNLVGMQYRIDHLENLRADVFDQIALPALKIRGDVDDFNYGPGAKIYLGEEGDVSPLVPDATALNADFQIQALENKMEELAGAPRQAMGIRTPGEKTAFEVQSLNNAAGRIFQHKAEKFEREFIEPVLNAMLESARRNINITDVVKIVDSEDKIVSFNSITKDDLSGNGKVVPVGASHFAERATRLQHLQQIMNFKQDPTIAPHLSGKVIAKILSEELGETELYGENIVVREQLDTQKAAQDAEASNMEQLEIQAEQGL
jgi:hypothetical protein